jgi:hypothetical protein
VFEEVVAERFLMASIADPSRSRFIPLWLRARPGS